VRPSAKHREKAVRPTPIRRLERGVRGFGRLSLCLLLVLLIQWLPVFANSGPPRILPDQNKAVFTENPGVALVHEHLKMVWDPERYRAEFTVTYTFENTLNSPQALTLWFMSGDYEDRSFKIRSSSGLIPSKDIEPEAYHLENWAFVKDPPFVTAYNEPLEQRLDFYGQTQTPARITEWLLKLAPREQTEVVVSYEAKSGYLSHSDYFTVYRTLYYALSPAQYFDGEAVVDLELIVPRNWSAAANLPLELEAPGLYTLKDYAIGTEDLYISLLNKDELMLGLNSRSALFGWTWPAAAVSFMGAILIARRRKRLAVGLVIAGTLAMSLNLIRPSYGMIFMMMLLLPVIVVSLLFLAAVLAYIRYQKKRRGASHIDSNKPMD